MKRMITIVAFLLCIVLVLSACGKVEGETQDNAGESTDVSNDTNEGQASNDSQSDVEKKSITFYGKIVEYASGEPTCEKLQEILADNYDIDCLQVDWGNLDQVIRTGIASGEPCDIYNYWPQFLTPYVNDGMCLDLTPYLDANDGEWRKTFDENVLKMGTFDGKTYIIPCTLNYTTVVVNVDIFKAAGVTVPEDTYWAWDDFLATCQKLKDYGVYPFAFPTDNAKAFDMIANGLESITVGDGTFDSLDTGELSCLSDTFMTALQKTKDLYDLGYMYPGEGAVTLTTDESRAAFYQGKVAMCYEVAAGVSDVVANTDFESAIVAWPCMGASSCVGGGGDGLFIPSNVADPDAAVEVLKVYTSAEVQQINGDYGFAVSNIETKITNPLVEQLQKYSSNIIPCAFTSLTSELSDYCVNEALADLILGDGVNAVADKLEELRLNALK